MSADSAIKTLSLTSCQHISLNINHISCTSVTVLGGLDLSLSGHSCSFLVNFDILQQTIFLFLTMWSVNIWHSYPLSLCIRPSLVRSLILLVTITQPGSDAGKRTGVFSKCMFWIHDILQRIIKEQVQFGLTVFQQQSDSKWTKYAPEHVAVYYCARHWQ